MTKRLISQYIKLIIDESLEIDKNQENESLEDEALDEFSGVGAIAGYTGPLGIDPDKLGRKKLKQKKRST